MDFKVAKAAANNPTDFDLKMNTFGGGDTGSRAGDPAAENGGPRQDMANEMTQIFGS